MGDFVFSLSLLELTILILGVAMAVGLGLSVGIRRLFRLNPTNQEADLAIDLMQIASTYIGILLAFAGVLAWQDYKDAENAIQQEASSASEMYRDLAIYGAEMAEPRNDLRAYIGSIVRDEWPLLREGKRSDLTEAKLLRLFEDLGRANPTSDRQSIIYREAFSNLNSLVTLRRERISASRAQIPDVLWIVALTGSILTIAYASAFASSRYSSLMITGVSLTIGLLFLFLLSVDYPFRGRAQLSDIELTELVGIFDKIDRYQR